jgi:uncharacterized protein
MSERTVIVMAKAPVPGRVKTRCCPPCTAEQAASLAEAALRDTLTTILASRVGRCVIALDGERGPWLEAGIAVIAQRGAGLGERIDHAFTDVGGPSLLIGMDTPQLDPALLDRALTLLGSGQVDALVGPAADGGFWALGLRTPAAGLCATIPMSVPSTCGRLRVALHRRGLTWRDLDELVDVDDFATAIAVAAGVPRSRFAATVDHIAALVATDVLRAVG